MGFMMSKVMEEQGTKQQQFMLDTGRLQLERQMMMQNMMRERMMAMQIAKSKELLNWTGSIGGLLIVGCVMGAIKTKRPPVAIPVLPIGGALGYQYDLAYGNKMERIRKDADTMLLTDPMQFDMPLGPITFSDLEDRRVALRDEQRFRPNQVFL